MDTGRYALFLARLCCCLSILGAAVFLLNFKMAADAKTASNCNNGIDDKLEVNEGMYIEMPHHVDKVFNLANK